MKLILTDYIASLKEDRELDSLVEEILKESGIEIVFGPKKGMRQQGVDIYAVGEDWEDGIKKLFLITVKQGNLDRNNWEGSAQALQPSLQNIVSVFIRNNVAPEHKNLPVKIIVAHNGINDATIQQNWRGFADLFPAYEFCIWQLETLVGFVLERLINENVFTDKSKRALRKVIISLSDPDYDFADYCFLLDEILAQVDLSGSNKRHNLNHLRKVNLLLTIVVSYCEQENDLRLALKASELTALRLWKLLGKDISLVDKEYFGEFLRLLLLRKDLHFKYLDKLIPACVVKDGLSKHSHDPVSYCYAAYEQLGFIAIAGLEFLQLSEAYKDHDLETYELLISHAEVCAGGVVSIYNNNQIVFIPRADDHAIEINLCFMLLFMVGRIEDVRALLYSYCEQIGYGKVLSNVAPHFHNNAEEIYELEANTVKRKAFDYQSSCMLLILAEWTVVVNDSDLYQSYADLKKTLFEKIDLILWFPEAKTQEKLFTSKAHRDTGHSLSGIKLPEDFEDFKQVTLVDYLFNSDELEFSFLKEKIWIIGLIASRHFRTYVFPHYWRQFVPSHIILKNNPKKL